MKEWFEGIIKCLPAPSHASTVLSFILQTLKRANNTHTIGSAIIYECVRTITTIFPNPQLLASGEREREE